MHMTHNISDCHKYENDGTYKKGFGNRATSLPQIRRPPTPMHSSWQRFSKLEKLSKRLKKGSKKQKHDYDSESDDSTPSKGAGLVAQGGLIVVRINRLIQKISENYFP